MKMKGRLLLAPMMMVIVSVLGVWRTTSGEPGTTDTAPNLWTTGRPGVNLNGDMFKLSFNKRGLYRYRPNYYPHHSNTNPYQGRWYTTANYPPMTMQPARRWYPTNYPTRYPYPTNYPTRPRYPTTYPTRPRYPTTYPTRYPYTTANYPPITMQPAGTWYSTYPPMTTQPTTTNRPGVNLNGKMFTLSYNGGGISLSPPNYSPHTTSPYTQRWYTTTYPPMTTQPSTTGLSVCLRYLTDSGGPTVTLSPSSRYRLSFQVSSNSWYSLSCDRYSSSTKSFLPNIKFWPDVSAADMWTSVCLTVDTVHRVAQVFSGSNMSIRKMLPFKCSRTGEPVMDISAFDGQVTDVQVWDYPLLYREVINYMSTSAYKLYRGSVLTWSDINYSLNGDGQLEDVYEIRARQPIGGRGKKPRERMNRQML
ncbi:Hypothetical protein SMAX5B_001088 [Scophthalmus maximus]|uniref:Uncharacterized protein n=1 Tax=Scophthalmus maximus TaxID=52904 RepID=A0A2U9BEM9_SCOMX|nr:adhesive plaque matrix protein isoform X1 [Scophthalmus maximus]AWP02269.1 Hypothetical protein SMAX5B_001088 [Scophthalmus maximus]